MDFGQRGVILTLGEVRSFIRNERRKYIVIALWSSYEYV